MKFLRAFTILELVFVIIIISILASISIPLINNNKTQAKILKLKVDYETIQSAIAFSKNEKFDNLYPNVLDEANENLEKEKLFFCSDEEIKICKSTNCCNKKILNSPIYSSFNSWIKIAKNKYRFYINKKDYVDFVYENGNLECKTQKWCKELL